MIAATGPTGPTGGAELGAPVATFQGLSAQSIGGGAITIGVDGTPMPLRKITYMNGFTSNGTNTEFRVGNTGAYLISYSLFWGNSVPYNYSVAIKVNGLINDNTVLVHEEGSPVVRLMSNNIILPLMAGSAVQLVVYTSSPFTDFLSNGANASLTLVKIS